MKTILTTITFAIALMVFAFNTNSAMAGGNSDTQHTLWSSNQSQVDELNDPDQAVGGEEDFAYRLELWCEKNGSLKAAFCSKGSDGSSWIKGQFAGMSAREKQQYDEDFWNAWILKQFAVYQNDDNESFDGFDRDFADSGEEGSTSAAGADR